MVEPRPRNIPVIDIELESSDNVATNLPVVYRDFVTKIFQEHGQKEKEFLYTNSQSEYIDCVNENKMEFNLDSKADNKKLKPLKWFVPEKRFYINFSRWYSKGGGNLPLTLLGSYLILAPFIVSYQNALKKGQKRDIIASSSDKFTRGGNVLT